MNTNRPAIKVVQYIYGEENSVYEPMRQINAMYCKRHGYAHVVKSFEPCGDRSRHWAKQTALREEMEHDDCDFILFLDADAFFYSQELRIEDELLPYLEDRQILMAADLACEGIRNQAELPNTGVILLRNSSRTKEILKVWDESSERPELEPYRFQMFHEQEACWRGVWNEYADDFMLLGDYYLMNGRYGVYIRHLMGLSTEQRWEELQKILNRRPDLAQAMEEHNSTGSRPEDQAIVRYSPKWQWAIGMMTTNKRSDAIIARTLESYRESGFDPPVVFSDLYKQGALWNCHRALTWLVKRYPDAQAYVMIEDDVLFSRNIRPYLEEQLWPGVGEHGCICSLFTPTIFESDERWHTENRGWNTWMAQFRIFHPKTAKKLVRELPSYAEFHTDIRELDNVIGQWALDNRIDIWFHNPSLVQHIATKITSYGMNETVNYNVGMARDFIGENVSIKEYLTQAYPTRRPRQSLHILEVFSNSQCPKNCPRCDKKPVRNRFPHYQFTSDMARHLAEKINEYNCDITTLQFVGGEPLLWEHWEECVHIMRMTGKVKKMKMITALLEGVAMKPYEDVFDVIGVSDYGFNHHLIERNISRPSMYEIHCISNHHYHPRGRIPGTIPGHCYCRNSWLWDDKIYLCPNAGTILTSGLNLKMPKEEIDSYSWSLDEFFSDVDAHRQNFGNRNICEACHVNSRVRDLTGEAPVDQSDWHGNAVYEMRHQASGIRLQEESSVSVLRFLI